MDEIADTKEGFKLPPIEAVLKLMFDLEDLREYYRRSAPNNIVSEEDTVQVRRLFEKIKQEAAELPTVSGNKYSGLQTAPGLPVRAREETTLNMQPIQAGGRLTKEARKALIVYGDGYSVCDNCRKPFRLDAITKPNIHKFYEDMAKWLNMDQARVLPAARRCFQAVMDAVVSKGDTVLLTALSHYTEFLSAEQIGANVKEVPLAEGNKITAEAFSAKIEELVDDGITPALAVVDHFDYSFGNEHEVKRIGQVLNEHNIPFLYNGAYTVGLMPVDGKAIGADFVVGSGHKSMSAPAPTGVLAINDTWKEKVLSTTKIKGDVTGRTFGIKEVQMLGCTVMGAPLLGMFASFPTVKKRVKNWDTEVERSNYFVNKLLEIPGTEVLSEMPRKHTLTRMDTTGSFDKIASRHKKRGYYFTNELKDRGIIGIFEGATKSWKINTYGLSWDQIKYAADAFQDIAVKYDLM